MAEFILPEPKAKSDFVLPKPKPVMPPKNWMDDMMKEEGFKVADKPAFILPEPKKPLYEEVFDTVKALTVEPVKAGYERFTEAFEGDIGVPNEAFVPGSEAELEFFGFNTDNSLTPTNIAKTFNKQLAATIYDVGDFAVMRLPFAVFSAGVGTGAEAIDNAIGEIPGAREAIGDVFKRHVGEDDIKEGIEGFFHHYMINKMSGGCGMNVIKAMPKDVAKQKVNEFVKDFQKNIDKNAKEIAESIVPKEIDTSIRKPALKKIETIIKETWEPKKEPYIKMQEKNLAEGKPKFQVRDDIVEAVSKSETVDTIVPGPKHRNVSKIEERIEATPDAPKDLIRRDVILQQFLKDLDLPIEIGGNMKGGTLGYHRNFLGLDKPGGGGAIRLKNRNQLEVAAHEVAHYLDSRIPEIKKKYSEKEMANEIRQVSYDVTKLHEGFAEFIRFYMTDPVYAKEAAPKFFEWFDTQVRTNKLIDSQGKMKDIGPAVLKAQTNFSNWYKQSALDRAKSKIGAEAFINEGVGTKAQQLRVELIDVLEGVRRYEKGIDTQPVIYMNARNAKGMSEALRQSIKQGALRIVERNGERIFEIDTNGIKFQKIINAVGGKDSPFWDYAAGRRAKYLFEKHGIKTGFTAAEIQALVGLEKKYPQYKKLFKEYQEWWNTIVEIGIESGLFSREQVGKWRNVDYVPFNRVNKTSKGPKQASDVFTIKMIRGSERNIGHPLDNIIKNARTILQESINNQLKLDVIKKAEQTKDSGRFIEAIKEKKRKQEVSVSTKEIRDTFKENVLDVSKGLLPKDIDLMIDAAFDMMGDFTKAMVHGLKPKEPNTLAVLKEGKIEYYRVADPLLFRALESLNTKNSLFDTILGYATIPTRIGRSFITLAVDFIQANFVRDTLMSGMLSKNGYIPFKDAAVGLKSQIFKDKNYRDWVANGGSLSSFFDTQGLFRGRLERFYTDKGINFKKVITSPLKLGEWFEALGSLIENASRVGEFSKAQKKGKTVSKSVFESREISTDFSLRGAYDKWYGQSAQVIMEMGLFIRPAVLGGDRVYRGLVKDSNKGQVAAKLGAGAGFSVLLAEMNRTNPLYIEMEDWDKDAHWHFFLPTEDLKQFVLENGRVPSTLEEVYGYNEQTKMYDKPMYEHWRLPKLWEPGAIMSIAERAWVNFQESNNFQTALDAKRIIFETFRLDLVPFIINPPLEVSQNRLRFLNRPIESMSDLSLPKELRGGPYTSKTIKALTEFLGRKYYKSDYVPEKAKLSAPQIEALIRGYTSTIGNYFLMASDYAFFDDMPDLAFEDYPGVRRFRKKIVTGTKYGNELFELFKEVSEVVTAANYLTKTNQSEKAKEYIEDKVMKLRTGANNLKETLQNMNGAMKYVLDQTELKPLQEFAENRAKSKKRNFIPSLIEKEIFNDIGKLKSWLREDMMIERNVLITNLRDTIEKAKEEINE